MRTNLEKWNYYLSIVNNRTKEFIDLQKEGKEIPEKYYIVYPSGKVVERIIIDTEYSHHKHGGRTYFSGKKPTREDIAHIQKYSNADIPFAVENTYFKYSEIWDKEKGYRSTSSVKFIDVINKVHLYYSIDDTKDVVAQVQAKKEFLELHKKDKNYNYRENDYKFLGWQNGWSHVYYDEDGNLCSESGKQSKTFGYTEKDYPEYGRCRRLKHTVIEVHCNQRGSENIVSCPICKIYWKYDSSD